MRYIAAVTFLIPQVLRAQEPETFTDVVNIVIDFSNLVIYFLIALSIVVFMWGVMKVWIVSGGDAYKVQEGKKYVVAGIVGLFVMVTVWGLVRILAITFLSGT